MKRKPNILLDKADAFSTRIIKMQQYISSEKKEFVLSKQVLRSGTSICANLMESKNAQSSLDYLSKHNIALKEADETSYWIKKLYEGGFINEIEYNSINNDCVELIKMLVSSVKTLKMKNGRPLCEQQL